MRFRHLTGASAVLACAALTTALLTGHSAETRPDKPALDQLPAGWETASPRDEIRPAFSYDPTGGPKKDGAFIISARRSRRAARLLPQVTSPSPAASTTTSTRSARSRTSRRRGAA